ncbi:hypothetical protein [Ramlibacter sp. WS9]|uniref:hypothetical protein n=1 Tax=Ramlibacter sp. WS9 TaxID=1882741 RepID=UPI001143419C|nr:hypothetical protein [Ramlibacter sp. WS9]ROZ75396.1 hypothetical protein EEB15_15695 [Ramlibacter sp. WS9]
MTRRRERQKREQPIQEAVRVAVSSVVGNYGEVEVERHSYDWRADDLFVRVRAGEPLSGATRKAFRSRVAEVMRELCPAGQPFEDWMVVVQRGSETLDTIAWHEKTDESDDARVET